MLNLPLYLQNGFLIIHFCNRVSELIVAVNSVDSGIAQVKERSSCMKCICALYNDIIVMSIMGHLMWSLGFKGLHKNNNPERIKTFNA